MRKKYIAKGTIFTIFAEIYMVKIALNLLAVR